MTAFHTLAHNPFAAPIHVGVLLVAAAFPPVKFTISPLVSTGSIRIARRVATHGHAKFLGQW